MSNYETEIQRLAQYIQEANKITILTGAGISTESGIPDFRSTGGFWTKNRTREELMSNIFLQINPSVFWEAYKDIFKIKLINDFQPNYGHQFLAELEKMGKDVTIITQNVDGLHKKAGSSKVYEAHGNINSAHCPNCKTEYDLSYINDNEFPKCNHIIEKENVCNNFVTISQTDKNNGFTYCENCETKHPISSDDESIRCKGIKKKSIKCTNYLKPGVILFGDAIKYFDEGIRATVDSELFLVLGSSLKVGPINQLPMYAQHENKDRVKIIINRDPTEFDDLFDDVINASIGDTFKEVNNILSRGLVK